MPCKHAHLALIYAQQMAEMDEPWKLWEKRFEIIGDQIEHNWKSLNGHPGWSDNYEYRQIPKTIQIGAFSVPEPMREKPEYHSKYYFVSPYCEDCVEETTWSGCALDYQFLSLGICHLTRDNCIAHAKALFSFSEVG